MLNFPVGKSDTSPGKPFQWFNCSQCWETSFYFKAEFVWLQFLPIGSYFGEAYFWLALSFASTCEYQLSCPFVLFRHIKFLMSVSAGIVLQDLVSFQLSFKLISMSSYSLKADSLVWAQFFGFRSMYKVKVTLMLPGSSATQEWHQHCRDHYFLLWILVFSPANTLSFWFPNLQPCIVFCRGNPAKPVLTSADSAAGLVGIWGYMTLVDIGTACQVAVFYRVGCLCVTSTHGNGKVLPMTSISQQFALQLSCCLSTLGNVFRFD